MAVLTVSQASITHLCIVCDNLFSIELKAEIHLKHFLENMFSWPGPLYVQLVRAPWLIQLKQIKLRILAVT